MKMQHNSEKPGTSGLQSNGHLKNKRLAINDKNLDRQNVSKGSKIANGKAITNKDIPEVNKNENIDADNQHSSTENEAKTVELQARNIKSLADLIGFCRESGIQVYNDKPNVPEADRIRMQALGEQGNTKRHSRDDKDPNRRSRSKNNTSDQTSTKTGLEREASIANSTLTAYSTLTRPSESGRSRVTISSVFSSNEKVDKTKDAEELLLLRMRKRSKRRRENRGTLIDLVTEVKNMAEVSKMKLTEEAVNSENPDIMLNTKDTPESTVTADDPSKPALNQMEEPKSSKVTKKLETNKNESKIKNVSDNTKDIKPDVSMNKGKGLKNDNKKVKKFTANQELSADKTTKTTGKDNIAKLNHTKRQNKKKDESDKSERTQEVSINPGVDKDNETSAISGYEPNTEKETSTKAINLAQTSDSNNTFKEQDENKMKTDDITNKDIYQNTTTNEGLQNMDFDKKENTNINDKTLEKVGVEDGQRNHESTQVEKTDEDELGKDDHDRSKSIDVESNDLQNESKIQNDNTKDIKPDVSMNKGKGLKNDNKKVKKSTANQELSAYKTTKTTGKENIAKLNHTKRQNKKKGGNDKSEKTREMSINPGVDKDNETSAISGYEPNTEKEVSTEVINLAQKSDSNNTFEGQDENKMKADDMTNKDIYQNTTTNETFQNIDFDKKEQTNINDKTLEKVMVEDGQRSHESTQVEKTDEDELGKDEHNRSKNIYVASNDLNDRDNTDKKESDKESNVRNNSAGQDSKRVGSVEKRIENIDQNTTINESFQNTDADKKEISNRTTETLATVIAENEPRSHESTQLDKIDEHELDKNNHNTSKSVDAECNELNDRDIIDKKESGKESDVSNTSTGQDSKRVGSGKIRNKSTDQGTTIIVSLPNIDAGKNENTNSIPETLETVIAADKEINHESTRIDKTDGYDLSKDTHGRSKSVDVECSDRDSLDKNKFYKTDDHKECADGRDIRSDVREDELYIPDDVKGEEKNSSGESFSQERSDSEILKEVADVNQPSEKETEYESENIIEEVRIKDGKSTLVLYKVKEKSLLNVERNDSGDIVLKHKIANNDRQKSNIQPLDGDINHNTSFENEGSIKRSEIKTETSKEARHIVDKHKQDDVDTSVSAELSSQCINSHHDVINSENSLETNAKPNKTEISKGDSYIQSVNHNGGININQDPQENTSIEKESLFKNNINNDQMYTGISNGDKIQEKSINDDKNEGKVHFDKGKNVNDEKTGNDHLGNEIKHNTHDINSKQELTSDSYSDDRNAVISDQEKTDDMAVIKDEPATKVNYQEDGESGFSEDEKSDVGYEGKGKGKKETKLEPGTDNTEQPERRKSKKGMTAETSIASDRMLSSQARMILLMEKTKQTNENYGKEHIKTIKLFEETRGVFSDLEFMRGKGRGLQFRENSSEENAEITEEKEEPQTAPQDQEQVGDVDTEQNKSEEPKTETDEKENEEPKAATKETNEVKPKKKKVKLAAVAPPKLSDERIRQIREMYWSNGQGNSETFELDGEEYFLDPNGELVKSIKFNASKKIDTRWDPNHPMFKKLQNKNKGLEIKGIVQSVKAAKPLKLKTNDISSSNVYVTEAKRIYPKGFEEDKNAKTENKKVKRLKSFKTKSVDIGNTGQEVNDSLTRIETNDTDNAIKKKLNRNASVPNKLGANDKHFSQETVEGDVNKRKLRKTKSVSSKIAESKNESNNDNETPEVGKKLRVKTSKYNNFVDSEKDNVSVTTAESSKENKTVVIKKKKKLKHKSNSSKEFEDDYAFLREQNEFSESTVKLDETEIIRNSKETVIKKHPKPAHKKSLPDLEFQTKDEQFNKCSTPSDQQDENNITNPNENDQQSDEITASRKKTIKKRIKKKRTSSNNLHALKIFQEAREDLPRDLSIIKDTNEDNSHKVPKVKKVPVEYSSSSSFVSGKSDMSMQTAVEIMQSRGKFYGNPAGRNGRNEPREHRVYRLYKEIQTIRRNTAPLTEPTSSIADPSTSVINDPDTGFLLLNYERKNRCFCNKNRRTPNADLRKFLYGSLDYEVCSKVRGLNPTFRRRLKAYDSLKMKMYVR